MKLGIKIAVTVVAIVVIVLSLIVLYKKKESYVAPAQAPVPVLPSSFVSKFESSIPVPHEQFVMNKPRKQMKATAPKSSAPRVTGSIDNPNKFTIVQDPHPMRLMTPSNFNAVPQLQALANGMSPLSMINKYSKFSSTNIDPAKNFL